MSGLRRCAAKRHHAILIHPRHRHLLHHHLSGLMLHMKMHVFHLRQPLAQISKELDENDRLKNEGTIKMLRAQIEGFKAF